MASIPSEQLGVLSTKASETLQTFPVPSPGPGEVLIQNIAVASNPKDWKMPIFIPNYTAIEGNDVAGIIVKVGEGYGAYAQYTVAPAATTFPIPESTSFEEAATLPLAVGTAFIGLFKRLGIPEKPSGEQKGIIINGASSSVGSYAVQLAKRAGLFVIGIAGSSKDYAKSLGADLIIDYREHTGDALEKALIEAAGGRNVQWVYDAITEKGSTTVEIVITHNVGRLPFEKALIEAATGKNVQWVYDAIAEKGSSVILSRVLAKVSPTGKGKVTFLLPVSDDDLKQVPEGIEYERTLVGTAYGEDKDFSARFYRQIGQWLAASPPFQPNRVKVLPDGLASVPKGLELLKTGKVHGEKLVYRIADTPGLK
ncbi:GroES-like protein [Sanghuangporus baumii]|uniref:GroES-like protein n=1 Tax=Sanghuangporus baumii TaxID=108892 RepID=A0A9Q5I0B1_SANBA|nr:GroES-like protein [Sanghuangporus baumii]